MKVAQGLEAKMAKVAAKNERRKAATRRQKVSAVGHVEAPSQEKPLEEEGSGFELFCMTVFGLLFALVEALEVDVLIGIVMLPVRDISCRAPSLAAHSGASHLRAPAC